MCNSKPLRAELVSARAYKSFDLHSIFCIMNPVCVGAVHIDSTRAHVFMPAKFVQYGKKTASDPKISLPTLSPQHATRLRRRAP